MSNDVATLMSTLGYQRWAVVGHDRGQGVAFRLAMDVPSQVSALVVLDGVPIVEALERADARFAELWWHWFFFASPQAERVITADPLAWYQPDPVAMGQENYDDLVRAINNPSTVRAMLEDYRAGLHVDRRQGEQDRNAGNGSPAQLWSAGPSTMTWSCCTAIQRPSGAPGARCRSNQPGSIPATMWRRRIRSSSPRQSWSSCHPLTQTDKCTRASPSASPAAGHWDRHYVSCEQLD
jgi:pimeloyl-ACP methyl ester carboxylesterase